MDFETWRSEDGRVTLYRADCLDVLPTLEDDSIDLILTDPPYNGVKDEAWDNQWATDGDYLAWLDRVLEQFARVLRFNGSLYLFASPKMAARVEVLTGGRFNVLNHVVWAKDACGAGAGKHRQAEKEALRSYFPQTERIIFAEHYNSDNHAKGESGYVTKCDGRGGFVFEPLRAYLDGERERAGASKVQINAAWKSWKGSPNGGMASHWFSDSQWVLPTAENYGWLRLLFHNLNHGGDYLRREYEDLRREYEDLRREYEDLRHEYEDLRRPFSVTADVPYTDVWTFPTVGAYPGKHPCEKPAAMLEHIIKASSRQGAVVLDPFMGSGTTGVACVQTGRRFIGIEIDQGYFEIAIRRIQDAMVQIRMEL